MKILFLHGWHSVPGSLKPAYLAAHGHTVINPALDDDVFDEAMAAAQSAFDADPPDVVVGSSRGGAVAMNIAVGVTPCVLLCPAWRHWGAATTIAPGTRILHAPADAVIPFAHSEDLVERSGLAADTLRPMGHDHRLADPESLAAMLRACEEAVHVTPRPVANRD